MRLLIIGFKRQTPVYNKFFYLDLYTNGTEIFRSQFGF